MRISPLLAAVGTAVLASSLQALEWSVLTTGAPNRALAAPAAQAKQTSSVNDLRVTLSKAIAGAEDEFTGLAGRIKEDNSDFGFNIHACDLALVEFQVCEVYLYTGREILKSFIVWRSDDGTTRAAAEELFASLVVTAQQALPRGWKGQETPRDALEVRELGEFFTVSPEDFGPALRITARRRGDLYEVTMQLNAHNVRP